MQYYTYSIAMQYYPKACNIIHSNAMEYYPRHIVFPELHFHLKDDYSYLGAAETLVKKDLHWRSIPITGDKISIYYI